jgi:peptidoglycan lytic transglycosylase
MSLRLAFPLLIALALAACSSAPSRPGGYYKDDGPGARPPADLASIADAQPRREPLSRAANQPYVVFGKRYVPFTELRPFTQRGTASWYGKRFHGQKTSSGERYDMYAMTAAHPRLPIPSYARVTNLANGRSVVVRINDRGPFHSNRIIDLSYAAAYKLGYIGAGSARVEVDSIVPGSDGLVAAAAPQAQQARMQPPAQAAASEPPAASEEPRGVYLQLGAFTERDNAVRFRAGIYRQLAWLSDQIHVLASGSLYKLHLGPYGSEAAASVIAARIQNELNLKPVFVVR